MDNPVLIALVFLPLMFALYPLAVKLGWDRPERRKREDFHNALAHRGRYL